MDKKGLTQGQLAAAFGVKQPSVSEWLKYGRISKAHIPKLLEFFKDVVGPDHWGLPISSEEFAHLLSLRELHPASQKRLFEATKEAAAKEKLARESIEPALLEATKGSSPPFEGETKASRKLVGRR